MDGGGRFPSAFLSAFSRSSCWFFVGEQFYETETHKTETVAIYLHESLLGHRAICVNCTPTNSTLFIRKL